MQELLKNAWMGWQDYIDAGKYIVFVMATLLLFWFAGNKGQNAVTEESRKAEENAENNTQHMLFIYGTIMVIVCICPITAAVLMVYQTRFYDYQWIWNIVPVTAIIGVGWVGFYLCYIDKLKAGAKVVLVSMMIAIMVLAGRMGAPIDDSVEREQLTIAKTVIAEVTERAEDNPICLWAPLEIMMYARSLNGEIVLPYGRDMWDRHLGAYSYDTYSAEVKTLYRYMSGMEVWGEYNPSVEDEQGHTIVLHGDEYLQQAAGLGVTHIILPQNAQPETVQQAENVLGVSAQELEGYYLLVLAQ